MQRFIILLLFLVTSFSFSEEKLKLYLFASSSCEQCRYLKELVLPDILDMYPQVELEHVKVDDTKGFELMLKMEEVYRTSNVEHRTLNIERASDVGHEALEDNSRLSTLDLQALDYNFIGKEDASVKAFVGKTCIAGVDLIEEKLEETIKAEIKAGYKTFNPFETKQQDLKSASNLVEKKFDTFQWWIVASAGFWDGINPCAFVTLVFFISVLANLRKSKRDIVIVGLMFSLAVFLTYLLLGLGALTVVKEFSVNNGIAKGINLFMAGFCIVIGLISLLDVMKFYKTHKADFKLKLPKSFRKIINRQINTKMRKNHLWFWALFLGVSVSLLESLCTGQVYLPTIAIMVKRGSSEAFGLLVLYNLMFIMPLLAIFAVTLAGVSSKQITNFFMKNLLLSKVLMTLLFLFLGLYLLLGFRM